MSCARLALLARPGELLRRIAGPYETGHAHRSLAVAGALRIAGADRFRNSLDGRSRQIPLRRSFEIRHFVRRRVACVSAPTKLGAYPQHYVQFAARFR